MNISNKEKIESFLQDLKIINPNMLDIILEVRAIIFKKHKTVEEKFMYGGIVFLLKGELFSGLFSYKQHVSIEFSKGFLMKDPNKFLEGKGKYRRHLKIKERKDIKNKTLAFFVEQAV